MRIVLFCHSLASCWNHGNAHFLRGVVRELQGRGHVVRVLEPRDGWSREQLVRDHGPEALDRWRETYPDLTSETTDGSAADLDRALDGAELVLVHEWTDPALIRELGARRVAGGRFLLLFHDTHHRLVSAQGALGPELIEGYDGVLAFGASLRERYLALGWGGRARVWHEAADTSVFRPLGSQEPRGSLVWIGNWGDEERTEELATFLLRPVARLGVPAEVWGVRYPPAALESLARHGLRYRGWLANPRVPEVFAGHALTVHVPRRWYVETLPGIPTIRVFEALACGVPLVCAPWRDTEGLFAEGCYLTADTEDAMTGALRDVLHDPALRSSLRERGLAAIRARHTCAHRVTELLDLVDAWRPARPSSRDARACA